MGAGRIKGGLLRWTSCIPSFYASPLTKQVPIYFLNLLKKNAEMEGVKKKMGYKAQVEVKYRSNLSVVRILTKPATKQTAFYSPPPLIR